MRTALALLAVLALATPAFASETVTPPAGVLVLDESYLQSSLNERWDSSGHAAPLIANIPRYEPGAGLQGTITAAPTVSFHVLLSTMMVGLTDHLAAVVAVPLVLDTTVHSNLGWVPGAYQPTLGRAYSESDFWQWAGSLGQSKPPASWSGNHGTPADMVVGARYRLPANPIQRFTGLELAGTLLVALPTGKNADPENLLSAGTNTWELDAYGDAELHLGFERPFKDSHGVTRFSIGGEGYYAYFRPRTYVAPTGSEYPLLLNDAPFVGGTYTIKPGDWTVGSIDLEGSPIIGPTWASIVSGGNLDRAQHFPALLTLELTGTFVFSQQTVYKSDSALFDWQHEQQWEPGNKNALKGVATVSLLRLGLPLQLYASYRDQTLIPGKNERPADIWAAGARVLVKVW